MKISIICLFSPPLRFKRHRWGNFKPRPGRSFDKNKDRSEGAAVAAPYADGSQWSDGPWTLGSGVLLAGLGERAPT